jgi:fructan beta-fructosidase
MENRQSRWACALAGICAAVTTVAAAQPTYTERFRPQIHYSPPEHWMNDPNGLVQVDGRYQLFYQYHPNSMVWGPMHWGHAESTDLLHWRTLPIALEPDAHGAIFSGSAVMDRGNTSQLGRPGTPPLVAIFTYHDHQIEKAHGIAVESQGLAYSLDAGRHFEKLPGPILKNPGVRDFRDPQVQWFAPTRRWIMTLVATDHVEFYSSKNLRQWRHESNFGADRGAHGGVWECPDLVRMSTNDGSGPRDVLLVSTNPGGPAGGGGTQYFVGHFDGHRFVEESTDGRPRWMDGGPDYYAAVTWNRDAARLADPPILLGWMSDWRYAQRTPTSPWRSAMAIPRELYLYATPNGHALRAVPIDGLSTLRERTAPLTASTQIAPEGASGNSTGSPKALDFSLRIRNPSQQAFVIRLQNRSNQKVMLRVDPDRGVITLDRSHSGQVDFDPGFAQPVEVPWTESVEEMALRILVDQSSVEIFLNDGKTDITALVFPDSVYDEVSVDGPEATMTGSVSALRSVW